MNTPNFAPRKSTKKSLSLGSYLSSFNRQNAVIVLFFALYDRRELLVDEERQKHTDHALYERERQR
jgi:hypothetical protein